MQTIIDCQSDVSSHASDIKAAGVETVFRYYNQENSRHLPSKRLTSPEAQALCAAGLNLAVVFEQRAGSGENPGHISDFDHPHAEWDAKQALSLADSLGQPDGSAIYFAVDHDFYEKSDLDQIKSYFEYVASQIRPRYRMGIYGSGTQAKLMLESGLVDFVWLSGSTGWSGTKAMLKTDEWTIFQEAIDKTWPGGAFGYDGNVLRDGITDFGQFTVSS